MSACLLGPEPISLCLVRANDPKHPYSLDERLLHQVLSSTNLFPKLGSVLLSAVVYFVMEEPEHYDAAAAAATEVERRRKDVWEEGTPTQVWCGFGLWIFF